MERLAASYLANQDVDNAIKMVLQDNGDSGVSISKLLVSVFQYPRLIWLQEQLIWELGNVLDSYITSIFEGTNPTDNTVKGRPAE